MTTKALDLKTPLQTISEFTKISPALTLKPRVFGCSIFVHIPKVNQSKLEPCAEKCVLVGYGVNQKGCRCYSSKRRHVYTTMNCDFLETEFYYSSQHSGQGETEYDTLSWLKWVSSSEEVNQSTRDAPLATRSTGPSISVTNQNSPSPVFKVSDFQTHVDIQNNKSHEN